MFSNLQRGLGHTVYKLKHKSVVQCAATDTAAASGSSTTYSTEFSHEDAIWSPQGHADASVTDKIGEDKVN